MGKANIPMVLLLGGALVAGYFLYKNFTNKEASADSGVGGDVGGLGAGGLQGDTYNTTNNYYNSGVSGSGTGSSGFNVNGANERLLSDLNYPTEQSARMVQPYQTAVELVANKVPIGNKLHLQNIVETTVMKDMGIQQISPLANKLLAANNAARVRAQNVYDSVVIPQRVGLSASKQIGSLGKRNDLGNAASRYAKAKVSSEKIVAGGR